MKGEKEEEENIRNTTEYPPPHSKVNARVKVQMDRLWHTSTVYRTEPALEYSRALCEKMPSHLNVCFFVNSGSEANDLALALARLHTGRFDVLGLRNSYHGCTQVKIGRKGWGIKGKNPLPFPHLKSKN